MAKRVSLKGKGADLFFGDVAPTSAEEESSEAVVPEKTTVPVSTRRQVVKTTSPQVSEYTSPQAVTSASGRVVQSTTPLVVKYTTHLRPDTIKAVKRVAFESERKDYEIVQEALDAYLKRLSRS